MVTFIDGEAVEVSDTPLPLNLCACGAEASANGRECPFHFRQRLLSINLDEASFDTVDLKNYYDQSSVDDMFGHDSKDRYMDETDGLGAAYRAKDGSYVHRNRKTGDYERLDASQLDRTFLAGDTEE